jgi:molybdopterin converting factor subunit 1
MTVQVYLFARLKELAGADRLVLEIPSGATVGDLRRQLETSFPAMADLLYRCRVAVADELVSDSYPLLPQTDAALLPPVSGG